MRFSGLALGAAAIAIAGLMSATAPASAAPLSLIKPSTAEQSMVEKTHGWHRRCRRGFSDWHRHIPGVGRVTCSSRRCYTNSWGVRRCVYN